MWGTSYLNGKKKEYKFCKKCKRSDLPYGAKGLCKKCRNVIDRKNWYSKPENKEKHRIASLTSWRKNKSLTGL